MDLVNPDLVNLFSTPPAAERYSAVFDGNARNARSRARQRRPVAATSARRIEHPRIAADYPETHMGDDTTALRFTDRDPVVVYFTTNSLSLADLEITNVDAPDPVVAGQNLTYTITVTNNGPDPAGTVSLTDTLPAGTTFVSLSTPGGWSCTTPAVGAGGTISCSTCVDERGQRRVHAHGRCRAVGNRNHFEYRERRLVDQRSGAGQQQRRRRRRLVDGAPTITDITDQTIDEDGATAALPFTIGDVGTAPAASRSRSARRIRRSCPTPTSSSAGRARIAPSRSRQSPISMADR